MVSMTLEKGGGGKEATIHLSMGRVVRRREKNGREILLKTGPYRSLVEKGWSRAQKGNGKTKKTSSRRIEKPVHLKAKKRLVG